jgi:mono/diheme cytochrome c family protein
VAARHAGWTISAAFASLFLASPLWFCTFTGGALADDADLSTQPRIADIVEDYMRQCIGCHGKDGLGVPPAVPRLAGFMGYYARSPEGRAYLVRVPGIANAPIDDARLTALLNWTLQTYSPAELPTDFEPFTTKEVATLRAQRLSAPAQTRRAVLADLAQAGLIDPVLVSATLGNRL